MTSTPQAGANRDHLKADLFSLCPRDSLSAAVVITPVTACPTPGGLPSGSQTGLPSLRMVEAVLEGACGMPGKALPGNVIIQEPGMPTVMLAVED